MRISTSDLARFEAAGMHLEGATEYLEKPWANDFSMAQDAQPQLTTTSNAGVPAFLTTIVDADILNILFAPLKAAKIYGERKKGNWLMQTALFPIVEYTGEVSTYGDYNNNGHTGLNTDFPNRQAYLYQITKEYGDLELERAGLARIAWAAELDKAAINLLNRYQNLTYFFGVASLENYGWLNDPALNASLTPSTKAAGGVTWFTTGGSPNATANEVYNDILAIFELLVVQADGNIEIDMETALVLAMSPAMQVALAFTNTFGITAEDMLKKTFPRIRLESAVQLGKASAANSQGLTAGNLVQMVAENVAGQDTGYCCFNEKLRTGRIIPEMSAFKQKATQGTFGAIIRQPFAVASMLGV